jgi:hypothetical protein
MIYWYRFHRGAYAYWGYPGVFGNLRDKQDMSHLPLTTAIPREPYPAALC